MHHHKFYLHRSEVRERNSIDQKNRKRLHKKKHESRIGDIDRKVDWRRLALTAHVKRESSYKRDELQSAEFY